MMQQIPTILLGLGIILTGAWAALLAWGVVELASVVAG
jgi:hypothetical protein